MSLLSGLTWLQDLDEAGVSPPLVILDHAQVLREMMVVYDSSLLGDENEEELLAGFRDILDKMVDPAIEMCLTGAEEKKKQRPTWDKAVFVLNTLSYLQSVLEPFAFTVEKRGVVQGLVEGKVLQLIEEHVSRCACVQAGYLTDRVAGSVQGCAVGCGVIRDCGRMRQSTTTCEQFVLVALYGC